MKLAHRERGTRFAVSGSGRAPKTVSQVGREEMAGITIGVMAPDFASTPSSEESRPPSAPSRVVEALRDPASYPHTVGNVEVHETHGSIVFLAGDFAYKMKKPIELGFFDYATLEKRMHYCREEVRLNRRLAPSVYLGVAEVREQNGDLALDVTGGGAGRVVEPLVRMRRLSEDVMLNRLLERDALAEDQLESLIRLLVRFYRDADRSPEIDRFGTIGTIRGNVEENFEQTRDMGPPFVGSRFAAIRSGQLEFLELRQDVFDQRIAEGWIRDCHGDLRAEHVAFVPDPVVVDCIEFADRIRYGDVASDLAFLKMDLEFLGHLAMARRLIDGYRVAAGDRSLDSVLDFYVSYRSYVRAKVDAMALGQSPRKESGREELQRRIARHFDMAYFHTLRFHRAQLILIGGLSGTGKTTLAVRLAQRLGAAVVRSDEVRQEVAAEIEPRPGFGRGRFAPEITDRTYTAMAEKAGALLRAGATVIADATFSKTAQRDDFAGAAHAAGAKMIEFECTAPAEVAALRMERRRIEGQDLSEATPAIQVEQWRNYEPPEVTLRLDTTHSPEDVVSQALAHLRPRLSAPGPPRLSR